MEISKEVISKLKLLSNIDYVTYKEDMEQQLEEINNILNEVFPDIKESDE